MFSDFETVTALISTLIAILSFFIALRPANDDNGSSSTGNKLFRTICVIIGIVCLVVLSISFFSRSSKTDTTPAVPITENKETIASEDVNMQDSQLAIASDKAIDTKQEETIDNTPKDEERKNDKVNSESKSGRSLFDAIEIEMDKEYTGATEIDKVFYKFWLDDPGKLTLTISHEKIHTHLRIWTFVLHDYSGIMNKIDVHGTETELQLVQNIQYADNYFYIEVIPDGSTSESKEYRGSEYRFSVSYENE